MRKFKFKINGNDYEVNINNIDDNLVELEVNGSPYTVEVDQALETSKTPKLLRSVSVPSTDAHPSMAKTSNPQEPKGAGNIKSPLPGVILDIYIKVGDRVKIGQKLLVLEAMKMENLIESDKEGTIISISKQKGDSVMEGDILISIGE
jgi:glutaconyl-CoA/methylmalonyl-CoA decarboxylase subunit gamma